jgi:hypothetical protein
VKKKDVPLEVAEFFCLDPPVSDLSILLSFSRSSLSLSGSRSESDCVASVGMIIQ